MKPMKDARVWMLLFFALWPCAPAAAVDWAISLNFSVPNPVAEGQISRVTLVAGVDATASDGFDSLWDVPVYYAGGTLQASFEPLVPGGQPLWDDFRSNAFTGNVPKIWTIHLNSNLNSVTLRWNLVPGGSCQTYTVGLTDTHGNTLIDPTAPVPSGTVFVVSPNTLTLSVTPGTGGGAPSAPSELFSPLKGKHGALLVWTKGSEANLIGYNLYRSVVQGANYVLLNASPISAQAYFDTNLSSAKDYYYIVRSVNQQGCEGAASPELDIKTEGP